MKKLQMAGRVLTIQTDRYTTNNALAVQLVTEDGSPYATLSVNIPEVEIIDDNRTFVGKNYSENTNLFERVLASGIIEYTGINVNTGMVSMPVCRLVD